MKANQRQGNCFPAFIELKPLPDGTFKIAATIPLDEWGTWFRCCCSCQLNFAVPFWCPNEGFPGFNVDGFRAICSWQSEKC